MLVETTKEICNQKVRREDSRRIQKSNSKKNAERNLWRLAK